MNERLEGKGFILSSGENYVTPLYSEIRLQ